MGSKHLALCDCGYKVEIVIGGTILGHHKKALFPFSCSSCGLVCVNIQKDHLSCPVCNSLSVTPYGSEPTSIQCSEKPVLKWGDYMASRYGNYCPKCEKFSLEFSDASVFFD